MACVAADDSLPSASTLQRECLVSEEVCKRCCVREPLVNKKACSGPVSAEKWHHVRSSSSRMATADAPETMSRCNRKRLPAPSSVQTERKGFNTSPDVSGECVVCRLYLSLHSIADSFQRPKNTYLALCNGFAAKLAWRLLAEPEGVWH